MKHSLLQQQFDSAIWVAHTLFNRCRVTGSTGNLSFLHDNQIYITASGCCFGQITEQDFSMIDKSGTVLGSKKPSKEWPLHLALYKNSRSPVSAVLHTHSTFLTLWSCMSDLSDINPIPQYTPYLSMKTNSVIAIPYHPPGSTALF